MTVDWQTMSSETPLRRPDNSLDPEGEFPLGAPEYFFYLLFQATRQRDVHFGERLAATGLDLAQWRTLAIIRRIDSCTMTSLARHSTIERTTLTRAVDQLVGRGIVTRWVPDSDRRQVSLALTDAGEEVYGRAVAVLMHRNREVLADIESKDLRTASRVLQAVLRQLLGDEKLSEEILSFGRPGG